MANENRRSEERKVELSRKLDEKVDKKYKQEQMKARKKRRKERIRAEKRKNSKFRNSKFGKKWFGMKKWKRIVVYVVLAVLLLALLLFGVVYGIYNSFRSDINEDNLGITTDIEDKYGDTGIFNVALFGVDTRDENSFSGRSDTIIIVSVDRANNTVKLSSILRDSYVAIEGHKNQKITHAYMYGGAELAIKTLNQNFGMNITDYVTVNFAKVAEAIDVLGGVDLEITERERVEVNNIGDDDDPDFPYIEEAGMVHLNGKQAVVYARIRHIDSDVARSERQRKVLDALLVKARQISPTRYAEVLRTMLSLCETSLSFSEIMSYAPMITQDLNIQSIVIPGDEDNAIGGNYDGFNYLGLGVLLAAAVTAAWILFAQRRQAGGRRVFGVPLIKGVFGGIDDVLRRIEIRFARAEADDGLPLRLHRLSFRGDGKGKGGRDGRNSLCRTAHNTSGTE